MPEFSSAVLGAITTLIAVGLGSLLTRGNQRRQRADERMKEQLNEFYAPFLGIHKRIRARSEFRVKLSATLDAAWRENLEPARVQGNPEILKKTADESWPDFEKAQEYANRVQREEIIPLYNKLVDLCADKMSLLEPSTRSYFGALVEHVEIWNRYYAEALPKIAIPLLNHDEDKIKPLYADVEHHVDRLSAALRVRRLRWNRGLIRLYTILAIIWIVGAFSFTYNDEKSSRDLACASLIGQGVISLPSSLSSVTELAGVRVQGPDGQMYLFPQGTTKGDAVRYFKEAQQRCQNARPIRTSVLVAFVPPLLAFGVLYILLFVTHWIWRGFTP